MVVCRYHVSCHNMPATGNVGSVWWWWGQVTLATQVGLVCEKYEGFPIRFLLMLDQEAPDTGPKWYRVASSSHTPTSCSSRSLALSSPSSKASFLHSLIINTLTSHTSLHTLTPHPPPLSLLTLTFLLSSVYACERGNTCQVCVSP